MVALAKFGTSLAIVLVLMCEVCGPAAGSSQA